MTNDIGILGTGLWQCEAISNEMMRRDVQQAEVKDPYHGRRDDSGAVSIAGMVFTPDKHARTLAAIERSFRDPYRGTRRRRIFPPTFKVSDAESDAARRAIADAGMTPADIGALLVQSFLPDDIQPKNQGLVAHNLGITHAPAWGVESICNSPITHFTIGSSLIVAGHAETVLCVQSSALSRVTDPNSSSTVQEADMASAFVLGRSPGARAAFSWRTDGRLHGAISTPWEVPAGAPPRRYWEPSKERLMVHFDPSLQAELMGEIAEKARIVCAEALARAEMTLDEIEVFISHQPMSWYDAFISDVLGLRDGVLFGTFEEYANINASSITASLHHARLEGRITKGTKVLMFGPAAGYTYGAAALRW